MKITENFEYIGTSQNFERDSYATLAEMKAVVDKRMPDIFTATCKETGKFYIYNKSNEIDETLGKWRELSLDSDDYVTKTYLDTELAKKADTDHTHTTVNGHTIESDVPVDAKFTDTIYDDTDIKTEIAKKADITSIPSKVSELANDSNYQTAEQISSTVTAEIAKVVANAPEDFDTLKEISDWIAGHENDASTMNSTISDNKTAITALQTDKADKSEIPTTVAELADSSSYAKKTDIPTTLPANGGNADTVNNHTVESNVPADAVFTDTTYESVTQTEDGLMSAADKAKLDGVEEGATKTLIDMELSSTSTNPVQNKVVTDALNNKADKSKYSDTTINVGRKAGTTVGAYSTAEGFDTTASGESSHAEGSNTTASGSYSHAEGSNTIAKGESQHVQGKYNIADETSAFIIGNGSGDNVRSNAMKVDWSGNLEVAGDLKDGSGNTLNNMMSKTNPTGTGSFSLNRKANTTIGDYSFAEGSEATASGRFSHAEGSETTASGLFSHAEGEGTTASADDSHAEGLGTLASGNSSHAEGEGTLASGNSSHAEGHRTTASGSCSHAEGSNYNSSNDTLPDRTTKVSDVSYTISGSTAYGINSHAEGTQSFAYAYSSHAEGYKTTASGVASHAEGEGTTASGEASHAEGVNTTASLTTSHAEGYKTTASHVASHAEGKETTASGVISHAEGWRTTASGEESHAEGEGTTASNKASHACGHYNAAMTDGGASNNTTGTAFVIGNGTKSTALSNAFSVQYDGTVKAKSTITASTTADYAEFFEWLDKNPNEEDRVGHFVTLDGDKIKIATSEDDYILGIVSGEPFVLGNGDCDTWNGMYLHDEFRRTMYEPAPKMIEILDSEGNPTGEYEEVEGEYEGTRPILNPDYDQTKQYISRFDRAEWSPIGMLGVLAVLHDGTAEVNGYVTVNNEGIATKCTRDIRNSYRVIKKVSDKVVEVIFR